jgi:3-oxoacyl-[acyl-carrier protein] reductase
VILMTSGQHRGPMPGELPYIAGKGALHQLTRSLAAACAPKQITVNCVDPGATDTGWAGPGVHAEVLAEEPFGRWGEPDDAARLIAFLCSDEGRWITGQVITSSGGGP